MAPSMALIPSQGRCYGPACLHYHQHVDPAFVAQLNSGGPSMMPLGLHVGVIDTYASKSCLVSPAC
jgi:hypothetical protein